MVGEFGDSLTSPRSLFPSLLSPLLRLGSALVSGWPLTVPGITSRSDDAERGRRFVGLSLPCV